MRRRLRWLLDASWRAVAAAMANYSGAAAAAAVALAAGDCPAHCAGRAAARAPRRESEMRASAFERRRRPRQSRRR
eukprot:2675908-Pyramimonas_sp.AAC.1